MLFCDGKRDARIFMGVDAKQNYHCDCPSFIHIAVYGSHSCLGKGKINEDGTQSELLAKSGLYKHLWDAQVGGFLGNEKVRD